MVKDNREHLVYIPIDSVKLEGALTTLEDAAGLVLFAHGSGSSRHSSRNNLVAQVLHKAGIGTLLFDLLTEEEDANYENRFDIGLLTQRLLLVTEWVKKELRPSGLSIGYFGASTGAAGALKAAASLGPEIKAVVSRGGRPDLAGPELGKVNSPTLFIVGGEDHQVIELNRMAYDKLKSKKKLEVVPGATHLFEEPGTLEEVAGMATQWFKRYLGK